MIEHGGSIAPGKFCKCDAPLTFERNIVGKDFTWIDEELGEQDAKKGRKELEFLMIVAGFGVAEWYE